ncbi:11461_t:CDS:2 [Dentiscutata erythropus]|uniref:11461_t:CDS:1 n=1 Tax=Dentiscutata erythropus TaxID=1348616 RepID=A0A9N8YXW5_9GLOM|nr:11461_t:CDS:2 [Dentiscutata erythropus]
MADKILAKILILLSIIISEVTASPTASELFNFSITEYVPYIIITVLLIITLMVFHFAKWVHIKNKIIAELHVFSIVSDMSYVDNCL